MRLTAEHIERARLANIAAAEVTTGLTCYPVLVRGNEALNWYLLEGPAVTAPAYPNLHRITYGEGARLTAEARVEAADALERINRTCADCAHGSPEQLDDLLIWCHKFDVIFKPNHYCAKWVAIDITSAHDKEKS